MDIKKVNHYSLIERSGSYLLEFIAVYQDSRIEFRFFDE